MLKQILLFSLILFLAGCESPPDVEVWKLDGETMGTFWHATIVDAPESISADRAKALIQSELDGIDASMSTWKSDSELSKLNRKQSTEWLGISPGLLEVITTAQAISVATSGALDITVGPLADLWGFGAGAKRDSGVPEAEQISALLEQGGYRSLEIREAPPALRKRNEEIQLDLSAVAKGYAVDAVAERLVASGIENYLVEVGGEIRAAGLNQKGKAWRIAVETPDASGQPKQGLDLSGAAVATSGDYRNYFSRDGRRYSHILDPRSGYPVNHQLASVTVVAERCAIADAWATALMVLGEEEGLAVAEQWGIAAYFIYRSGENFSTISTFQMQKHLY